MGVRFKTVVMSLLLVGITLGILAGSYSIYYMLSMSRTKSASHTATGYTKHVDEALKTPLERQVEESDRVNFLIFGTDGGRSDTIMVISYDTKNKMADLISIPRDTYVDYPSSNPAWHKINSIIERKEGGGPQGLKETVAKLLKMPISYYVEVQYKGVENIVDAVGGVEVTIPFNMNYDDPYCNPPLHIHLNAGQQVLNGDKAIQFLRWRKNNGQGGLGDLPRTQRQQAFLKSLVSKSMGTNLPAVIEATYGAIETDMNLNEMLFLGTTLAGFDMSELRTHRIPSENKSSKFYFLASTSGIDALVSKIYNRVPGQADNQDSDIVDNNGIALTTSNNLTDPNHQLSPDPISE